VIIIPALGHEKVVRECYRIVLDLILQELGLTNLIMIHIPRFFAKYISIFEK
jgi:hypothetical protein